MGMVGLHRIAPGMHDPPHLSPLHKNAQGVPLSQLPLDWHVYKALFSHLVVPGRQMPTHAPCMQRLGHVASICHAPLALHVRKLTPSQSFWPGSQMPTAPSGRFELPSTGASALAPPSERGASMPAKILKSS